MPLATMLTAILCLWVAPALAHKVNLFAYVEDDSVHTESYFSDGRKVVGARITVYDTAGAQLLEGVTDEEGLFAFKIPKREGLKILLQASMGHRDEYELLRGELAEGEATEVTMQAQGDTLAQMEPLARPDMDQIAQLIDRSLERRLAPVVATMMRIQKAQEKPDFRDVIGGIGYIVGMAGLVMYLLGRRT